MIVYRIAKSAERAEDISGFGSFKFGGRWNSKGTYMLYTSMNSSLAYLESLVHFNEIDVPSNLFISSIQLPDSGQLIYQLPDNEYPATWLVQDNLENKLMGYQWILENKFLAFKVRSAINPSEFNYLLNPLFQSYRDIVTIDSIQKLDIDARLIR